MGLFICLIFSVVCFTLVITQSGVHEKLLKPILEIETEDPNDIHMIGSTVYFNCSSSLSAQQFYLRKEGNVDAVQKQQTPIFTMFKLKKSDSGLYSCQYSVRSEFSEHSDLVDLYVSDKYPPATITAEPHSIVQPGQDVTIKCSSSYPNVVFTLFKGLTRIKENDNNPLIYVIHSANKEHAGQYSCMYTKLQMQSHVSSPLMIDVKALPRPLITLEAAEEGELKIICRAPEKDKVMWFQLFNESKDVIDEIKAVEENEVAFIVPYLKQSHSSYYCMYRIRMGGNFAYSLISDALVTVKESPTTQDYTMKNNIRFLLSTLILILLTAIVVKHFKSLKKDKSHPPELPATWKKLAIESEYAKIEFTKSEEDTEEKTAACIKTDYREESCPAKEEAKEVMETKNDETLEKNLVLTPPSTVVYAVIEKMEVNKSEEDKEEKTAASVEIDYGEETCNAKEEAKEIMEMTSGETLEKSLTVTPPSTVVYAVIKANNQEEQSAYI